MTHVDLHGEARQGESMIPTTTTTFRWNFKDDITRIAYAEGTLEEGRSGDPTFLLRVYLVLDEQRQPDFSQGELIDPEQRIGKRVYVTTLRSHDNEQVRLLAYLAPIEATRVAYTLMFHALRKNPQAVERYGDEWLTETMGAWTVSV